MSKNNEAGVKKAIAACGGRGGMAERFGVSRQAVQEYIRQGYLPPSRALDIHQTFDIPLSELVKPSLADLYS